MNGQASLPYGGYLGVGFLSNFDYDFYSPAPARSENSYQYSQGVRYDLFGSALQAHLTTQVRDIVYLNYYDADENNQLIVPQHQFTGFQMFLGMYQPVNSHIMLMDKKVSTEMGTQ